MPSVQLRAARATFVAAAVAIGSSPGLVAQAVRGTVFDSSTSQVISGVTIELLREDSQVVARESSDKKGQFRVRANASGAHRLVARRIGYRTGQLDSLVLQARVDTTIELRLAAVPVELSPVAVTGEANAYLRTSGFYERKEAGGGTFMDPPEVEKRAIKAKVVGDILDHIPGVSIIYSERTGGIRVPQLRSCRTTARALVPRFSADAVRRELPDTTVDMSRFPRIFLDGLVVGQEVFESLLPTDLLAVEVYMGPAQVPLQYGGTDAPCGVILMWSKR